MLPGLDDLWGPEILAPFLMAVCGPVRALLIGYGTTGDRYRDREDEDASRA